MVLPGITTHIHTYGNIRRHAFLSNILTCTHTTDTRVCFLITWAFGSAFWFCVWEFTLLGGFQGFLIHVCVPSPELSFFLALHWAFLYWLSPLSPGSLCSAPVCVATHAYFRCHSQGRILQTWHNAYNVTYLLPKFLNNVGRIIIKMKILATCGE